MEMLDRLDEAFALAPEADAVASVGERFFSFAEIEEFGNRLATLIDSAEFSDGTPVGILLRNRPAHFAAAVAVIRARHTIVTINPLLPSQALREDVSSLKAPVLVADREDWENPAFAESARSSGALGIMIETPPSELKVEAVAEMAKPGRRDFRAPSPGVVVEMLSSGTTGKPKRISLKRDALSRSLWTGSKYEAGAEGKLKLKGSPAIQWMPLVHIAGLFSAIYSIYNARRFILMEKFDLDVWHELLLKHRPRFLNIPPSRLGALLERNWPKEDFSSLLALRTGAAPLDHELASEFERRYGVPVLEGYGATEFAGGVAGWTIRDHRKFARTKRNSVGRANAGVELRIVDVETFEPLPAGEQGLLEVRTKQFGDGIQWIRTTDLASLDEDGFLYIKGRADNAINRGGFKIHPQHVEDALRKVTGVRDACVVGIADADLGQVPVAALELEPGSGTPDEDSLKLALRTLLKPYEIPSQFRIVGELPRTPSLKVSQAAVRDMFSQTQSGIRQPA